MNHSGEYKKQLSQRAERFIGSLKKCNISAKIINNSFRRYSVKVAISKNKDCGKVNIYYSPKRNSCKMTMQEITDKTILHLLEECWHCENTVQSDTKNYNIYVDGSFMNGRCGYGVVILKGNKIIDEISGEVIQEKFIHAPQRGAGFINNHRQVSGEIAAVRNALKWCVKNSVKEIYLHYDYIGIEKWITGDWQAKKELTRSYVNFVKNEISNKVKIHFKKVAAHSGDRYNELADRLAKKTIGNS